MFNRFFGWSVTFTSRSGLVLDEQKKLLEKKKLHPRRASREKMPTGPIMKTGLGGVFPTPRLILLSSGNAYYNLRFYLSIRLREDCEVLI